VNLIHVSNSQIANSTLSERGLGGQVGLYTELQPNGSLVSTPALDKTEKAIDGEDRF
jgi:hypothetical protein